MSHNLHFVVTKASSPKEACDDVRNYIEDWGNDNNWRTIMGCVSEDDEVYQDEKPDRYVWDDTATIEGINNLMRSEIDFDPNQGFDIVLELINNYKNGKDPGAPKWFLAKQFMEIMYQKSPHLKDGKVNFNILEDSIWDHKYDEQGVTHTGYNSDQDMKKYVVFVDMHS
jgi:hypothetical protein